MSPSLTTTYPEHPPFDQSHVKEHVSKPQPTGPLALRQVLSAENRAAMPTTSPETETENEHAIVDDAGETTSDSAEPITPPNGPSAVPTQKDNLTPTNSGSSSNHSPTTSPGTRSKRPSSLKIKTKIKSVFGRKNSQNGAEDTSPRSKSPSGSIFSRSKRSPRNSPPSSRPNSPTSRRSPSITFNREYRMGASVPTGHSFPKPTRASTGLSFRQRTGIGFLMPHSPEQKVRSPSLADTRKMRERYAISRHAETGAGLKSRRLSASLPDDFHVSTCELSEEYMSTRVFPGRRGKTVGVGATATVGVMFQKGCKSVLYAVKEFRKMGQNEDAAEYDMKVKSEFSIANSLEHPNIVKTFRLCTRDGRWNHVMEYCAYGELFSLAERRYFTETDKMCFFKQVVHGVAYLHENGIAHRDIKLENLLLTDKGHVKITDFGVSEVFSGTHPGLRSSGGKCGQDMKEVRLCSPGICGSMPYIAPEVLAKKGPYDPRPLDVWSCGIVFLALTFVGYLWPAADTEHRTYKNFIVGWEKFLKRSPDGHVTSDKFPNCGRPFQEMPNPSMKRLVLSMLHPDPSKRASIDDIVKDRYFKSIECCVGVEDPAVKVTQIDASSKTASVQASKMGVKKGHKHTPPRVQHKIQSMLQHRFDMGDGYS